MFRHGGDVSELFVALVAHEFLPARVNHHMPCEVTVLCNPIVTHVAYEWLFTGVRPHMSFPGNSVDTPMITQRAGK